MGQTDSGHKIVDPDGRIWYWVFICPDCGQELATVHLVENMNLDGDDIIGCDTCGVDVSVEGAPMVLVDIDGNRV